jgi:hypothetical protein
MNNSRTLFAFIFSIVSLMTTSSFASSKENGSDRSNIFIQKNEAGMLYFASYGKSDNQQVIRNPYIIGALYTIHWAEIESQKGVYNWDNLDRFIKNWKEGGKKVALRIMWSGSGYWPNPVSAAPTPKWVWDEGGKFAYHKQSKTEIPLIWDPIYKKNAMNFIKAVAKRYDKNPDLLFIDVTPGAETNPYRFGTINKIDPDFKKAYEQTASSDGRTYSNKLWIETVTNWISETAKIFNKLPSLVTLNIGSLNGENNFKTFGQCAVDNGMYVGQNGLTANSYNQNDNQRALLFREWSKKTKLFFEMVHAAETSNTGSLMEVMKAAQRINCSYLNVYAVDVIKSCDFIPQTYNPQYKEAMEFGYQYFKNK